MVITLIEKACELLQMFYSSGYEAYVVGGFVRDIILGRNSFDVDIATNATPKEVKKASALWCVEESREMTFKEINVFLNKAANNTSVRQAYYKAVKAAKTEFASNGYTWRVLA